MGGWEKHFPEPNLLEPQTICVAKELTELEVEYSFEVQTSRPKRESPDLYFNSLLIMINFLNHYLLMNFIFQIGFGLNNFYTPRTLKHNCDKCDYEHNCKKDLRKHIFNLQKEIRFILSMSSKNTPQEKSS